MEMHFRSIHQFQKLQLASIILCMADGWIEQQIHKILIDFYKLQPFKKNPFVNVSFNESLEQLHKS
jgi:hypothetical protein